MSEPVTHVDHDLQTFEIIHPEHGKARVDDRQFAEFAAKGWEKAKADKPKKTDEAKKPAADSAPAA